MAPNFNILKMSVLFLPTYCGVNAPLCVPLTTEPQRLTTYLPHSLQREREREGEREERRGEVVRETLHLGGVRKKVYISGFEGSQAVPARPSGRGSAYDQN
jgi:hypothetical protein